MKIVTYQHGRRSGLTSYTSQAWEIWTFPAGSKRIVCGGWRCCVCWPACNPQLEMTMETKKINWDAWARWLAAVVALVIAAKFGVKVPVDAPVIPMLPAMLSVPCQCDCPCCK